MGLSKQETKMESVRQASGICLGRIHKGADKQLNSASDDDLINLASRIYKFVTEE